jgi:hypothetical protein
MLWVDLRGRMRKRNSWRKLGMSSEIWKKARK